MFCRPHLILERKNQTILAAEMEYSLFFPIQFPVPELSVVMENPYFQVSAVQSASLKAMILDFPQSLVHSQLEEENSQ